jgi:hypothetical protein
VRFEEAFGIRNISAASKSSVSDAYMSTVVNATNAGVYFRNVKAVLETSVHKVTREDEITYDVV